MNPHGKMIRTYTVPYIKEVFSLTKAEHQKKPSFIHTLCRYCPLIWQWKHLHIAKNVLFIPTLICEACW